MLTASTKLLLNLVRAVEALGIDPGPVLGRAELTLGELEAEAESDVRVPIDAVNRFWSAAVAVTGDPSLGVRVGSLAQVEMYGVVGDVAKASATLGDALLKVSRYVKLWHEAVSFSLLVEGDRALLWYRSLAPEPPHPASSDAVMTMLLVLSRQLTGRYLVPLEARFARPAPPNRTVYREVFGVSPSFQQLETALVFPPEVLTTPIVTHDSNLGATLGVQADELVEALPERASMTRKVQGLLAAELRGGNPLLENIASQLGMHPKALTRRLREEGTSHRDLLDSLRRELAERYVSGSELNMTEVAFLLGFSDTSAFNKAFRRWSGLSPLAFRKRARAPR